MFLRLRRKRKLKELQQERSKRQVNTTYKRHEVIKPKDITVGLVLVARVLRLQEGQMSLILQPNDMDIRIGDIFDKECRILGYDKNTRTIALEYKSDYGLPRGLITITRNI